MSHARQALTVLRASADLLARGAKLPQVPYTTLLVQALGAGDAVPAQPTGDVLLELRRRLQRAAREPGGVAVAAAKDLRDAPWLLWAEEDPMADLQGLLETLLRLAERRAGVRKSLIEGWIKDFAYGAPRIAEAGAGIRHLLAVVEDARLDPWRRAQEWCQLFDAHEGPQRLAQRIVQDAEPVLDILARACLDDPLRAVSGYVRVVQEEVLRIAPVHLAGMSSTVVVARLVEFLAPAGTLRFSDLEARGQVARAMMAPWLTGGQEPSDQTRAAVQAFLLAHLGDPRIRASYWSRAGEDAVALMKRWLARASLKAFFEVIRDHAYDGHWRYREAFWSACLEAGGIDDAWLALGGSVHATARALQDLNGAYARLVGSRIQSDQSILLLRVGKLVFCEWSHNGKLRAWPADWKTAPKLQKSTYTRDDVIGASLPFPSNWQYGSKGSRDSNGLSHVGSEQNRWQGSVARMLEERVGIHLTHRDWAPR
jgi:hypothetical protein